MTIDDDVVACETVVEEKCEEEIPSYTTNTKCSKGPKEVSKEKVLCTMYLLRNMGWPKVNNDNRF